MTPLPFARAAALSAAALATSLTAQINVDLSSWTAESYQAVSGFGAGAWTVAPDGLSVVQSVNGQPTIFYSNLSVSNARIEGQLTVGGGDDDLVGFVLGFDPGDTTNPNADYLLVDWKRGTQGFNFGAPSCTTGSTCLRGLAISRVEGVPTADEFWGHVNLDAAPCSTSTDRVTELARGNTLGSTGWNANTPYLFRFDFTPTQVDVFVDGVLELSVSGQFEAGRFGFYNFSQGGVTYEAFTADCVASASNYGTGQPGTNGIPSLTETNLPVLGTSLGYQIGNAANGTVPAVMFFGLAPATIPTPFGTILVDVLLDMPLTLPPGGTVLSTPLANDPAACGLTLYAQLVHLDLTGPTLFAFSPGLEQVLGN